MTNTTQHTPGPWEWVLDENYHCLISTPNPDGWKSLSLNVVIDDGSACGEYSPSIDVTGPDAALIAAAPELLEALEGTVAALKSKGYTDDQWLMEPALLAIKKAKGKS